MNRLLLCLIGLLFLSCQSETEKKKTISNPSEVVKKNALKVETIEEVKPMDTLLNNTEYLIIGDSIARVKVVKERDIDMYPSFEIIIGYRDDIIIGEGIEYENVKVYRKYNPQTHFDDFPAPIYKGKLAEPDFESDPEAKRFITRIKKECANGINFAGHYTLVTWGCGSPCQSGVIVDRKTGKIYGGYGTALGAEFKKDSKMVIRNIGAIDTTTNLIRACAYCGVNHEIWTGSTFKEVK